MSDLTRSSLEMLPKKKKKNKFVRAVLFRKHCVAYYCCCHNMHSLTTMTLPKLSKREWYLASGGNFRINLRCTLQVELICLNFWMHGSICSMFLCTCCNLLFMSSMAKFSQQYFFFFNLLSRNGPIHFLVQWIMLFSKSWKLRWQFMAFHDPIEDNSTTKSQSDIKTLPEKKIYTQTVFFPVF